MFVWTVGFSPSWPKGEAVALVKLPKMVLEGRVRKSVPDAFDFLPLGISDLKSVA